MRHWLYILFFLPATLGAQTYEWQNPKPFGGSGYAVAPFSVNEFYVVGGGAAIFHTTDGGQTWGKLTLPVNDPNHHIYDIEAISADTLIVSTNGGLWRSTDGGQSWTDVAPSQAGWENIEFYDGNTGWTERRDIVYKTTDGGQNWTNIDFYPGSFFRVMDMKFFGQTGILVGNAGSSDPLGYAYKTTDGGQTWTKVSDDATATDLKEGSVIDENTFALIGWDSLAFTTDGGQTWSRQGHNYGGDFKMVASPDGGNTLLGFGRQGLGGPVYSTDGGQTWQNVAYSGYIPYDFRDVAFLDNQVGFAVGDAGTIIRTTDGGMSWTELSKGGRFNTGNSYFKNAQEGWIAADEGYLFHTIDGGQHWDTISTGGSGDLTVVASPSSNTIYTMGWGNYFTKSTDGGQTWTSAWTNTIGTATDMVFFNDQEGMFTFDRGVARTTDGGQTWTTWPANDERMNALHFLSNGVGFMTSGSQSNDAAAVWKTVDHGATWNRLTPDSADIHFSDIFMLDEQNGYLTGWGDDGFVWKTTDGGNTWAATDLPDYNELYKVWFSSPSEGWIIGQYGLFLHTSDGGQTWEEINLNGTVPSGIFFVDANNGWVNGHYGTIIKIGGSGSGQTAPAAPSDLQAVAYRTGSNIRLSWDDNSSDETGFIVERTQDTAGFWSAIDTLGANAVMYEDLDLPENVQYFYRVAAINTVGMSTYSNVSGSTTLTGIAEQEPLATKLYPNPAATAIHLQLVLKSQQQVQVQLIDWKGATIQVPLHSSLPAGMHELTIQRGELADGFYLLQIKTDQSLETHKVLFQ